MGDLLYRSVCRGGGGPSAVQMDEFCSPDTLYQCYCTGRSPDPPPSASTQSTFTTLQTTISTPSNDTLSAVSQHPSLSTSTHQVTQQSTEWPREYYNCSKTFRGNYEHLSPVAAFHSIWSGSIYFLDNLQGSYADLGTVRVRSGFSGMNADSNGQASGGIGTGMTDLFTPGTLYKGNVSNYEIVADLSSSYNLILGILFTSLTGICK